MELSLKSKHGQRYTKKDFTIEKQSWLAEIIVLIKEVIIWVIYTVKNNFDGKVFWKFEPIKLNIYFERAKFTLDFKTNIQLTSNSCFEIKGKFRSFKINI